ncbi:MAG: divalent metal cation transporter [Bacteroidetes bacterium]|nr:divalent metal cation transporter [Bacteroidota bacterium]
MMKTNRFFSLLGPGLLYAGAAIGVSHLVQSTRAGAEFGFELLGILLLTNLLKYPFFEMGSRYVLAKGGNLVDAYAAVGKWVILLFFAMTIITMIPVQAALTIVTAGLSNNIFHTSWSDFGMSALITAATLLLLLFGKFKILDRLIKVVILLLTLSTIVAVVVAWTRWQGQPALATGFDWSNRAHILFLVAFIGWMPAPVDIVVWTSIWTQTKFGQLSFKPTLREVLTEYRIGYFGTMVVAAFFLALGAFVMYGTGEAMPAGGAAFAGKLIGLYTQTIGQWAYPVIAVAAFTTMFSTTITVLDAYPRTLVECTRNFGSGQQKLKPQHQYLIWMFLLAAATLALLKISGQSMRTMVDLATSISFVTAPFLAFLNYKIIFSESIEDQFRPGRFLKIWAWVGLFALAGFTVFYLIVLFRLA